MKYKRALVTGAAGFIGSHLMNSLIVDGHEVVGIDNFSAPSTNTTKQEVEYADVRYYDNIENYVKNTNIVFHLAAQIHVGKSNDYIGETLDVNLMGTYNILEACRKYDKPMVFASTSEIYGGHDEAIHEGSPTYSQSPYATAKLAADKLCGNYHDIHGVKVVRLRNFNTFGPHQKKGEYGAVIPIFVDKAYKMEAMPIFGDGSQERDFMYIDDAVAGYKMCMDNLDELAGEPINVGNGESISINALAEMISQIMHRNMANVEYKPARKGEVKKLQADITLAKKYGYSPKNTFRENLEDYIKWVNLNR